MQEFRRVAIRMPAIDRERADRVVAEVWAAGASGVEEVSASGDSTNLLVYCPAACAEAVRAAAVRAAGDGPASVGPLERVDPVDWSQAWKRGLTATVVSDRLVVRPSFVAQTLGSSQRELVIDPGQAFGTGGHASTLLALQWLDALAALAGGLAGSRVLDVGSGTGVLSLAALRLGAARAVACDLDPVAARESARVAAANGIGAEFHVFAGTLSSLLSPPFDLVLANLLRRELLPIADSIARAVRPGGLLILSGLLVGEVAAVTRAFSDRAMALRATRSLRDSGGEEWGSLLLGRIEQ